MSAVTGDPRSGPLSATQQRNRRLRNVAIGLAVAALAALFYGITIVKMAPGFFHLGPH